MNPQLIPFTEPQKFEAAGLPFRTEHQIRWAERQSQFNGLAKAFVKIGRRKYIDVPKFHELVQKNCAA